MKMKMTEGADRRKEGDCVGKRVVISRFRLFRAQSGRADVGENSDIRDTGHQQKKKLELPSSFRCYWPVRIR